jgi:hypothetical protein
MGQYVPEYSGGITAQFVYVGGPYAQFFVGQFDLEPPRATFDQRPGLSHGSRETQRNYQKNRKIYEGYGL